MTTVGVDLGGTNVYAVVLDGEQVLGRAKLKTPVTGDRADVVAVIGAAVKDAIAAADGVKGKHIDAVGIGTPGVVIEGTVGGAANVPGFVERFSLTEAVGEATGFPVHVTNDVTAAAIGEHRLGAGRGVDHLLAVFVGTGVGGGLILDGRPYEGGSGGAGEFGHIVVRQGGATAPGSPRGSVEAYAGRRAMELAAQRARTAGTPTILFDVMEEKGKPRVTSGVLKEAYDRGDLLVADLLDDAIEALGAGIASAVNLLDVDRVVLGGGLADRFGPRFLARVDAAMRPNLFLFPPRVELVGAALGDEGGAIGAALLAAEGG
jgi:glucokinase